MRGHVNPHALRFRDISPDARVPPTHPLRRINTVAEPGRRERAPIFAAMYSAVGRPSIPPERLAEERGGDRAGFGAEPSAVLRATGHRPLVSLVLGCGSGCAWRRAQHLQPE